MTLIQAAGLPSGSRPPVWVMASHLGHGLPSGSRPPTGVTASHPSCDPPGVCWWTRSSRAGCPNLCQLGTCAQGPASTPGRVPRILAWGPPCLPPGTLASSPWSAEAGRAAGPWASAARPCFLGDNGNVMQTRRTKGGQRPGRLSEGSRGGAGGTSGVGKHSRTAGAAEGLWEEQHTRAGEVPRAKVPGRTVFSQCRSTGHPWAKKGAWTSPYKNLARRGHRLERQMCASKAFRRTREKHDQRAGLPEQNLGCLQMRRATRPPTR